MYHIEAFPILTLNRSQH